MKLFVDRRGAASPSRVFFYGDGSFGGAEGDFVLDYEIDLTDGGRLEVWGDLKSGVCYRVEGYSWLEFGELSKGSILISEAEEASLRFELGPEDPTEWGMCFDLGLFASRLDPERSLVLFGELPAGSAVFRFADGQYIVMAGGKVQGFVVEIPDFAMKIILKPQRKRAIFSSR